MPTSLSDVVLESLRGGLNEEDPPNALQMDECVIANNVEHFYSTLGERRLGGQKFDLTGSAIPGDAVVVFAIRHFPTANILDNELWVFSATVGVNVTISRRTSGGWSTITPPVNIVATAPTVYQIQGVSFDSKLYICANLASGADRMLVWDGSSLRLAGIAAPVAAPTVVDEGVGTFTGTRYYRVRYAQLSGATIIRESEPSPTTTFNPSGAGAGARISKPAAINEGETHWIVEASSDGANFYQIAQVPVGTATYDDTTNLATTSYASLGTFSVNIGEDVPLPNARYIIVDDDRLVLGGNFVVDANNSRTYWTPTRNATGFGNSERIPADTDNFKDLDPKEGGGLQGLSQTSNGSWYAFKSQHIYSATRTGVAANAYDIETVTKSRGAIFGSVVAGTDEFGRSVVYFCDQEVGPSRIGPAGLQRLKGLRNITWKKVNATATQAVVRGVFYPAKEQMWWFLATGSANAPNLGIKLQVSSLRETEGGAKRGWTTFDGLLAKALTATLFSEQMVDGAGNTVLSTRPVLGFLGPDYLMRADLTDTDNGTAFFAKIRTRPIFEVGLLNRWGAMTAALLAAANGNARVQVAFIRNYGLESNYVLTTLAPQASEDYVIKAFDNLVMSSAVGVSIEFSDVVDGTKSDGVLYNIQPGTP